MSTKDIYYRLNGILNKGYLVDKKESLKAGAVIGMFGGFLGAIIGSFHPFESLSGANATIPHMMEMATSIRWTAVHIGIAITTAMMLGGLVTIALAHRFSPSKLWAALGLAMAVATSSLSFAAMAIDGFAMKKIAERFMEANAQPGSPLYIASQGFEDIQLALFGMVILMSFGLTQLLFGLAVLKGKLLPGWLGAIAVLTGATSTVIGVLQLVKGPTQITIKSFIICAVIYPLWIGVASFLIWRGKFTVK